jgi:RsiW-degrading membrane proteinase PrsW (M82 family)
MISFLSLLGLVFAAALPALIWLVFFRAEDCHPEPRRLILYTFSIGALVSIPVLGLQLAFQSSLGKSGAILPLLIGFAIIEEVLKFLAAYWAVNKNPAFKEPVDAMINVVAAALGFATVENLFIIGKSLDLFSLQSIGMTAETLSLRFVGATLLHVLTSALIGYYWARARLIRKGVRDAIHSSFGECLAIGFVVATAVHVLFNYLILRFQSENLLYPSLFLIGVTFFVLEDFERLREPDAERETPVAQ